MYFLSGITRGAGAENKVTVNKLHTKRGKKENEN